MFLEVWRPVILGIRKSVTDYRRSQLLVQQRPVRVILCILSIHVFCVFLSTWMYRIVWRRLSCNPGHLQIRNGSAPQPTRPVATPRPGYPAHPAYPCSIIRESDSRNRVLVPDRPSTFLVSLSNDPPGTAWAGLTCAGRGGDSGATAGSTPLPTAPGRS